MNYTKGPWRADSFGFITTDPLKSGYCEQVAELPTCFILNSLAGRHNPLSEETQKDMSAWYDRTIANARLIAAAPELYEALKQALKIIESEPEACGIYKENTNLIRAAINKAEWRAE